MDRRRITSRNPLHKQLHSASQASKKSVVGGLDIVRSVSATNASLSLSRKRKNSEEEEEEELEGNNIASMSSSTKSPEPKKKKRSIVNNSDDDETDEEAPPLKRPSPDKKTKEVSSARKKSDGSDKGEENEPTNLNRGSFIRGFLEALDKSPAKLSQSSNSSIDKYRKVNLRTPLRSKPQKPVSKAIAEKTKEKVDRDPRKKKIDLKQILPGPSSSKKKTPQKVVSDDEEMSSDSEVPLAEKITNKKKDQSPKLTPVKSTKAKGSPEKTPMKSSKPKGSPEKTPVRSLRKRVVDSPELSPLRTFESPERERERVNITQRRKRNVNQSGNKFEDVVNAVGITLCSGDNSHIASDNPIEVVRKMKELITTNGINEDEFVRSWKDYIEDGENLKKSLMEMRIETEDGIAVCSKAVSLSRLLLQVPQLQVEILKSLFSKLIDAVITTESSDDAPWALQMLQQFRFLETIIDSDVLVNLIEELLSSSPEWFQREVIVFIPDIVTDAQHRTTAEMLVKIMESNSDLTNIILDCIHNLILGKEYREELREKILGLLDQNLDKSNLPAITRFILNSCSTEAIALKSLNALRTIDMAPLPKEKADECYTHQSFMVNAMKMSIQLFKEVAQAAVAVIKSDKNKAVPLDVILSILLYETTPAKKKIVETTLLGHIKTGHYKTGLLGSFYSGYKSVARSFQSAALSLAISLLKADSQSHVEFGIEWVRYMFVSQADTSHRQREIMEKLLNLMGTKDKTVKNALEVLIRMSNDETECRYLQEHVGFLRSFLEKIDNLHFDEVATLYHLLHGLCTHSQSIANILNDDLSIIMQKQLCSSKVQTKCKGVLGAVMAIKHLSCNSDTKQEAYDLLRKTIISLKDCKRSEALFYDQLAQVFSTTNDIDADFLTDVTNELEEHFVANCLVENTPSNNLVPRFGIIDPTQLENMTIYFGNCKFGAYVSAFFKLLRICNFRISGNLESINGMLGCAILMPEDLEMPEPSTADHMIHCINWFRETIGAFVLQDERLLREQVLQRLDSLMNLQSEFVMMITMIDSRYQPPPCYFNYFPTPQFVRLDLKAGKKGKKVKKGEKKAKDSSTQLDSSLSKSIILPEWENWERGSELTAKNPAFFRRMDTKIIHLLDVNMDIHSTQSNSGKVTIAQVCFIVKELLNMFENKNSESFIRDVILLLPKICKKLQTIVADLRENDSIHEKEAVRLIFCLFISIFNWKEFKNARYNSLLRDGLRALAGMINESSALLRSCKDLVVEAYKYFESLSDIATQISLAVALVNLCESLMKHSDSFSQQSKDRQAKMAYGFLCLEWDEPNSAQYKAAIKELLRSWIENEPDPLKTVKSVLEWLSTEALTLERPQSRLSRMPSVAKINFHLLLKQLFIGLVKGVHISLEAAETDPERIKTWSDAAKSLEKMSEICRSYKNNFYLTLFLRYSTILYQSLLSSGMNVLEANAKYQFSDVMDVIKAFQKSNRFMRDIFCTARKDKNVALIKLIPLAKSKRERFIYRVKGMCAANNSIGAFWMGNLLNKDLDGEELGMESSEEVSVGSDQPTDHNSADEAASEILDSDSDDDVDIECD